MLFILENIYVRFGNKVAKQKIGIPIGLDSGQDIANLLLYFYESEYILQLSRVNLLEAKRFCNCYRYIDDLFAADFPNFSNHLARIYPQELTLTKSNNDNSKVDYLDLKITSENNRLTFNVYDKRDAFNFEVVNFPYLDSCIPRKPALGIYYGQLLRYARICTKYIDFYSRARLLSRRLMRQGYKYEELKKLTKRFFKEKGDLLVNYHENNLVKFLNNCIGKG